VPYSHDPRRRLDPVKVREVNDGYLFEELVTDLMRGLLSGIHGSKVTWPGVPLHPGGPTTGIEMDWVTWLPRTYDYADAMSAIFVDVEASVLVLDDSEEYVTGKILSLKRLIGAPGGIPAAITALRGTPAHSAFPELASAPVPYLIFVSNRSERLPDATVLRNWLKGRSKPVLDGSDPAIECAKVGTDGRTVLVTLPDKTEIHVGLVDREKLLELTYFAIALDSAKRHDLVNERFLHDLTLIAGRPALLEPMPRRIDIYGSSAGAPVRVDGKLVTFYRFSIDPFKFIRMGTVLRLVSDYAYLQRLPDGRHLAEMAQDLEAGGRFPTPVLCIPAPDNIVLPDRHVICQSGGSVVSPYQWHIIDGQHRAFSYYLVRPGAQNIQPLDINCYELASLNDKATIASALFLNVNYKAMKPPVDLALAHYAYATQWPSGMWVARKRGRMIAGDSQYYSSRVLASRFLLELSDGDTVFHSFFKYRGAKDRGKTSIQSISTYLGQDFDLTDPSDATNPIAQRFGTVPKASGIWTSKDPAPESLKKLWATLVDSFDEYLCIVAESGSKSLLTGTAEMRNLVSRNNNVFVALWRSYFWYAFKKTPGTGPPAIISKALAGKILPWLDGEMRAGHLSGPDNKYRSGSGANSLSERLTKLVGGP